MSRMHTQIRKIKVVSLDLDNTLWDVERTIIKAESDMRQWMFEHIPDALELYKSGAASEFRTQVVADNPTKVHDLSFLRIEVLCKIITATGISVAQSRDFAEKAFAIFFRGRNEVAFFPGALEMLNVLAQKYTIFALTNGNADVEKVGISHFLAGAVSSANVGASKPDPLMFTTVLQKAGVKPEQCIHVGDHLTDDIYGANNVGMHTLWVNLTDQIREKDQVKADIEVNSLQALSPALEAYQLTL
jgi:putative hydrolase of the HAD superfamily